VRPASGGFPYRGSSGSNGSSSSLREVGEHLLECLHLGVQQVGVPGERRLITVPTENQGLVEYAEGSVSGYSHECPATSCTLRADEAG